MQLPPLLLLLLLPHCASPYEVGTFADASDGVQGPYGLCLDSTGIVYVANTAAHNILKITPAGVVSVHAGSTSDVSGANDGSPTAARFENPYGCDTDTARNIYVADRGVPAHGYRRA